MEGTMSEIRLFAGDFAPKTWAFCQGQLLAINTNQALFALLGTTYGGNGTTTFALPNMAGRVPMGTGSATGVKSYILGEMEGTPTVTCLLQNMPAHTHSAAGQALSISAYSDGGNIGSSSGATLAALQGLYSNQNADSYLRNIPINPIISQTGLNQPIEIQQPYLGINYIICLQGIFPSRN